MGAYLSAPVTDKHEESGSADIAGGSLSWSVVAMQGWRRAMEDSHTISVCEHHGVFGVFDGHGGSEVARFCAAFMAPELRGHAAFAHGPARDVPAALAAAFHRMDDHLRRARPAPPGARLAATAAHLSPPPPASLLVDDEMEEEGNGGEAGDQAAAATTTTAADENAAPTPAAAAEAPATAPTTTSTTPAASVAASATALAAAAAARTNAGCTALVAVLSGRDLWVANAGDSRAVLCSAGGTAIPLSSDHKPGDPGEGARIRAAGGFVAAVGGVARVNGSLALSRAIGDLAYKDPARPPPAQVITAEPDVRHFALSPGDRFLVLACDGVWDVLSNQAAVDCVAASLNAPGGTPSSAAHALVDACLSPDPRASRGAGCDNMTAAVVVLPTAGEEGGGGGVE